MARTIVEENEPRLKVSACPGWYQVTLPLSCLWQMPHEGCLAVVVYGSILAYPHFTDRKIKAQRRKVANAECHNLGLGNSLVTGLPACPAMCFG